MVRGATRSRSNADGRTAESAKAVSLGLIVTELVIHALNHAFPNDRPDGQVVVSYQIDGSDWKLVVADNGIGKPDIIATPARGGLGTTLVTSAREVGTVLLELKLAGRIEWHSGDLVSFLPKTCAQSHHAGGGQYRASAN